MEPSFDEPELPPQHPLLFELDSLLLPQQPLLEESLSDDRPQPSPKTPTASLDELKAQIEAYRVRQP